MPTFSINGTALNVEINGQGPAVVALHGFTGSGATWAPLSHALCKEYTVVRVDLLGHGKSDSPLEVERYSIDETISGLIELLDRLNIPTAYWLGYSMGGRIALAVAISHPHRCTALLLESVSAGILDAKIRTDRVNSDERLANWIENTTIEKFVDYWESLPLFSTQSRLNWLTKSELRTQRLANNPIGLANSLRGIGAGAQPPLQNKLNTLEIPTLLIVGEDDTNYVSGAKVMENVVKSSELITVSNAGHAIHLEQPGIFYQSILGFLGGQVMKNSSTIQSER